jgi:hypothetical protein
MNQFPHKNKEYRIQEKEKHFQVVLEAIILEKMVESQNTNMPYVSHAFSKVKENILVDNNCKCY